MFITQKRETWDTQKFVSQTLNHNSSSLSPIVLHRELLKSSIFLDIFLKNYLFIFSKQVKYLLISRITLWVFVTDN